MPSVLAFGITAASRPDHPRLGAELVRLGYEELWCNDTRHGDGLAALAGVARGAETLRCGVGVIALSELSPADVAERVRASGLTPDRLTVGVGSGSSASLGLVREGVTALRRLLPEHAVGVAAVLDTLERLASRRLGALHPRREELFR